MYHEDDGDGKSYDIFLIIPTKQLTSNNQK